MSSNETTIKEVTPVLNSLADTRNMNNESNLTIDLNADLGEGMGGDEAMVSLITSLTLLAEDTLAVEKFCERRLKLRYLME